MDGNLGSNIMAKTGHWAVLFIVTLFSASVREIILDCLFHAGDVTYFDGYSEHARDRY